jgi:protein-disulfide isomerase
MNRCDANARGNHSRISEQETEMTEPAEQERQKRPSRAIGWTLLPLILIGAIGVWFAFDPNVQLARSFSDAIAAEAPATMSKDEFEQRVRAYLLEHPEVIGEAINRLEAQQREQDAKLGQAALKSHLNEVFGDANDPVGGNLNGDATLAEFFDYNCPYCKQMASVMTQAESADPKLRIVYKEFPILGPDSLFAAKAALAANKQGKYVAFHRALYQARGHVDESKVLETAKAVGLDVARLKVDMQAPEISARLDKNIDLARALGINGTPGFAIGDRVFTGATDLKSLQTVIEASRKSSVTNR